MINQLIDKIKQTKAPIVVGLDPMLSFIPEHIRQKVFAELGETLEGAAEAIWLFNKEIVDQNNQKILDVIHESFGEVTPANIEEFKKILKVNQYKEVEKEDQEKYNYENYSS